VTDTIRISVTTLIPTANGFVWFPAEASVEDYRDLQDIHDALVSEGEIFVQKLITKVENGRRTIVDREPTIVGRGMVGTITPLHQDLDEGRR
jgi:hypothetical protein